LPRLEHVEDDEDFDNSDPTSKSATCGAAEASTDLVQVPTIVLKLLLQVASAGGMHPCATAFFHQRRDDFP